MRRYELSDFELSIIHPRLPNRVRGVARVDDRKVLNGIPKSTRQRYRRVRSESARRAVSPIGTRIPGTPNFHAL